ncbi:MAG: tRNA pseudouridine(38-40) synthase TruA [Alphaproteobacteria bacterium]|nr:tRNA pseudouridine(38-40) synthase TruA [Alphaproteobacteria bacterium]
MSRYKVIIEYDGTPFHGWQRQEGYDSVQQRVEEAMLPFLKKSVPLHCAGRTDAGVHALGQVAHFDFNEDLDCFRLQECMNFYLTDVPICILSIEKVPNNFHARLSPIERSYVYKILNRRGKATIDANRVWVVSAMLDEKKMHSAAQCLVGKHDFSSFRSAGCQQKSPIKTVNSISIERYGNLIEITISAKSFLYHQVRNIVGSLRFVGCGKWSEDDFRSVFEAKDRTLAGPTAPACGLYFIGAKFSDNNLAEK